MTFENPTDDSHTEAGMIDVGIAGDDDDIAAVPTKLVHFIA